VAKELLDNFIKSAKFTNYEISKEIKGQDLVGLVALHPLYGRKTKVVHSDHVNLESGTGIVHIALGFGVDDFALGLKHKITALVPIDDQGNFTAAVKDEELINKFYDDTNKIIVERLKASENLVALN
jgi:isoleucyl-tRNA synthetase